MPPNFILLERCFRKTVSITFLIKHHLLLNDRIVLVSTIAIWYLSILTNKICVSPLHHLHKIGKERRQELLMKILLVLTKSIKDLAN
jgi:hypothetical protein